MLYPLLIPTPPGRRPRCHRGVNYEPNIVLNLMPAAVLVACVAAEPLAVGVIPDDQPVKVGKPLRRAYRLNTPFVLVLPSWAALPNASVPRSFHCWSAAQGLAAIVALGM